jgi:hypothetical protein
MLRSSPAAGKTFDATLERGNPRLGWVIIRVPLDVEKIWGTRGMFRVRGEINGFAFRTSLFPTSAGEHVLLVNKRMQAGAGVRLGSVAHFRLEPDTAERVITVPVELKRALAEDRALRRWFDTLNYSMRKWLTDQISQPKSAAARMRRAEQIAELILATMDAERELPPVLQAAFARDPRARKGWERMSALQRRQQLMAIFYYRSPEARARRVAKVVAQALACADKA